MIHIEHLYKRIGSTSILSDVSLHVTKGEVVGLLGPNGAGKSTLMKVLTGLWKAEQGRVEVCGVDVLSSPDAVHPHIGYLPEQNPLYADMYVREYLLFIARMRDSHISQRSGLTSHNCVVEQLINLVGLTPQANKRIREPEVLILDEPTTGLDPNQLEDIRALIRDLGKHHTVILSTHILQEVKAICSRVVIIDHGQIRLDRPLDDIPDLDAAFKSATTGANTN